ncbi:hypothetical protein, partial [Ramlibacter albus]|uniref:hypothetical protein n=1 Tax=Ramlibacter albus TaxID=2079448 RepID=UPI001C9ABF46
YKGFPVCQAIEFLERSSISILQIACAGRLQRRMRTAKLQTVIDAAGVLRTLMKDARGGLNR